MLPQTHLYRSRHEHAIELINGWSLQNIFPREPDKKLGLTHIPKRELQHLLDPIYQSLKSLDAEKLFALERVEEGGAMFGEG